MTAILSPCKNYRYLLTRKNDSLFANEPEFLFCGLNPSTASSTVNDNTINRLRGYMTRWGAKGFSVINLYAYRSKDPSDLATAADPVGPDNDNYIKEILSSFNQVICGWGGNAKSDRVERFIQLAKASDTELFCFSQNADGSPGHPLYLKADLIPKPFKTNSPENHEH